jgi:hypothetical protein
VLVTVCGIPNSAELGVRIQNSAEFTDREVILWNPDAARAESADRGSFSLWEQAWTRSSAVCTVYENGSPAGEEPPNAKFFVLHARCSHYDGCWTLEQSPNVSVSERIYVMAHRTCRRSELHLEDHVEGRYLPNQGGFEGRQVQPSSVHGHLRRGAMQAKQRQADAVDRRYSRVSATQAQSVKPGMVVVIPLPKDLKGASGSDVGVKAVVVRLGTRQGYYVVATRYGQLDRELRYEELSVSKTTLVDIPSLMEVYSSQNSQQIVSLKRVSELVNGSSSNSKSQACKCTKKGCWLPSAQDGGMSKRSSCPCRQAGRLCGSGCHSQQSARSGCGCCNKDTQANVRSQAASATPVVHASEQASTHASPSETPVQSPRAEPNTSKHLRSPVPSSTASTPARASKAAKKSPTDAPHQSAQARSVRAATQRTKKAAVATAAPLAARASASKRFAPPSAHRRLLCYCARNRTTRADSGRCCTGRRPAQRLHAADPSHCPPLQVLTQGPNCERAYSTAPAAHASCVQPGCAYAS